ncbi:hypothetical protein GCM10007874_45430 [Labrys miyagiensis]|uniref:Uncharacterized protein n=1 Tax=Labrys miyagiensis TaxID=346912 RepID=A0ABQ6CMG9_9HYPH|nr:hypothetical protein GCM10007874_45430 [Labrys miyagiensis]
MLLGVNLPGWPMSAQGSNPETLTPIVTATDDGFCLSVCNMHRQAEAIPSDFVCSVIADGNFRCQRCQAWLDALGHGLWKESA